MNQLPNHENWMKALEKFDKSDCQTWFKFVMLWFSFNSYYSESYPYNEGEKNQIIEFAKDNNNLYESLLSDKDFKNALEDFKKTKSPSRDRVKNMRTNSNKCVKFSKRNQSCEDFFAVLYQIRCNFFHGDKQPFFKEDKELINWAFRYFKIFWERFLDEQAN